MQGRRQLTRETRTMLKYIQACHHRKYPNHMKSKDVIKRVLSLGQYDSTDMMILNNLRAQYKTDLVKFYKKYG